MSVPIPSITWDQFLRAKPCWLQLPSRRYVKDVAKDLRRDLRRDAGAKRAKAYLAEQAQLRKDTLKLKRTLKKMFGPDQKIDLVDVLLAPNQIYGYETDYQWLWNRIMDNAEDPVWDHMGRHDNLRAYRVEDRPALLERVMRAHRGL